MTDNDLSTIIDELNSGVKQTTTFTRPLTKTVDLAIHWIAISGPVPENYFGPCTLYLVKERPNGRYVGIIEDKGRYDLHWVVLPSHRGLHLLSTALRSVILPHLFQDNRDEQHITVDFARLALDNATASARLAEAVGFIFTGISEGKHCYRLGAEAFYDVDFIDGDLSTLTDDRANEIRKLAGNCITQLKMLHSELKMAVGFTDALQEFEDQLERISYSVDDIILDGYDQKRIVQVK